MQREPLSTSRNQMNNRDNNRLSKRSNHANNNNNSNPSLAVQATVPALTPAQMYSNFEEWIKMCTDNVCNPPFSK
jgi:condensin complex subunit 2